MTEIVRSLLTDAVAPQKQRFEKAVEKLRLLIEQDKRTSYPDIQTAIVFVRKSTEDIQSVLENIYKETSSLPILIPDTNALYENVDIESWTYEKFSEFRLIITPSVFKDLDRHKIENRNESVRDKANKLIKRFKEYRSRGQLMAGVPIVKGKISLQAIAKEANVTAALAWLDPLNDDDKLIAEVIEIIRSYANHPVYIVTGDINLQNKCELASIPFLEVPQK